MVPSHGGNYPVPRDTLLRIREEHPNIRIPAKTDLDVEDANQFAAPQRVDAACLGAHERFVSMMAAGSLG